MNFLRTPDSRLENLAGDDFRPNHVDIDRLRMHCLDEDARDDTIVPLLHGEPTWSYLYRHPYAGHLFAARQGIELADTLIESITV